MKLPNISAGVLPLYIRTCSLLMLLFGLVLTSSALAQDSSAEEAAAEADKPLTEEQVEDISSRLADILEQIEIAGELEGRVADTKLLGQDVLRIRVTAMLTGALEQTISLANELAELRSNGFLISAYVGEVGNYLEALPVSIKRYSASPGDLVERIDPSLSALEQSINDDKLFAVADDYDDSSWALFRSMRAARSLGLDTAEQEAYIRNRVEDLLANALILLDISLRDVSNMRAASRALPQDAEVTAKVRIAESRVSNIVRIMENNLLLLKEFGEPTSFYRQQILAATGKVSADVIDTEVLSGLVAGWMGELLNNVKLKGPNLIFQVLIFLFIIFVFFKLAGLAKKLIERTLDTSRVQMSRLARRMLTTVTGNVIIAIGFMVALSQLGISLGPVLAGLGIVGFIIGFALQDSLGNFASGVLILIYRPYDVGDLVEVSGVSGRVHQMSLVNTTILTLDNQTLIIPNNKIWQDVIKNLTYQTIRRVDLVFGITYDQDIDVVEEVIHKVLKEEPRVLDDPEPNVRVSELADSSVNLICRPWVKTDDYWDVYWDITKKVKQAFDANGITIPFPQRDVHLFAADSDGGEAAESALANRSNKE